MKLSKIISMITHTINTSRSPPIPSPLIPSLPQDPQYLPHSYHPHLNIHTYIIPMSRFSVILIYLYYPYLNIPTLTTPTSTFHIIPSIPQDPHSYLPNVNILYHTIPTHTIPISKFPLIPSLL